jgi:tellurite resistance protein TerC
VGESIGSPALWAGFLAFIAVMLVLDLGVFNRRAHVVKPREALVWSAVWISLAMAFNGVVWRVYGSERALEFLTGYLVEKALSVDNLFVFLVLFRYFQVPPALQHRVLFWGIVGAVGLRAAFIVAGAALISRFHIVLYLLGGFLIITGIKLLTRKEDEIEPQRTLVVRLFRRLVPMVPEFRDGSFTVVEQGRRQATLLLLVLASIEATDVIFAVDSIPAIFAITTDPFIVFTSNIFAILGLRALYFLLADALERLHYLKVGLGAILAFVGAKMLLSDVYRMPVASSLGVIAGLLLLSVAASLWRSSRSAHGSAST